MVAAGEVVAERAPQFAWSAGQWSRSVSVTRRTPGTPDKDLRRGLWVCFVPNRALRPWNYAAQRPAGGRLDRTAAVVRAVAAFPAIVSYSHVHDPGRVHGQSGVTQMRMNPQVTWGFMRYVNAAPG